MLRDIQSAVEDDKLAREYLGNFESLLKMAPQVRDIIIRSKYHINDGLLLHRFLQLLDWFIIDYDSQK
jgi:hypothetical protein